MDLYERLTENEVILGDFAAADFLRERVLAVVDVDKQPELRELRRHLRRVFSLQMQGMSAFAPTLAIQS